MKEFKGTRGGWYVESMDDTFIRSKASKVNIATMDGANWILNESRANALLISKAPEMLEMLQYLNRRGGLGLDIHNKIEQLIKQATEL